MLKFRYYDEDEKLDRAWYDSTNIVYSECEDKENDFKVLYVVFKNGAMYKYKAVNVHDYLLFMVGGLDGSNGKALNKYIKPKCECECVGNVDVSQLFGKMEYYKKLKDEKELSKSKNNSENTEK